MAENALLIPYKELEERISGEVRTDPLSQMIYATDASVYRELPLAVVIPQNEEDLVSIVQFANKHKIPIIPRAAGTSLAGQVVGRGVIVDFSRMNKILSFSSENQTVTVQPGIVRDELNHFLKPHGLFFSPITSTANRAMVGGMVGNNSCGTNSIRYGSARDKIISSKVVLSNGDLAEIGSVNNFSDSKSYYSEIIQKTIAILEAEEVREMIGQSFPKPSIHRRNTGYALDAIIQQKPFQSEGGEFNLSKLLAGSEGTLALFSALTLSLDPLPPRNGILVAIHFSELQESFRATKKAMSLKPYACELMDKKILDCTLENIEQRKNRFFIQGDPAAVLMVEYRSEEKPACDEWADKLISILKNEKLGYTYPRVYDKDINRVWALRSSGLGVLANIPGDKKAVACIEDTAVDVQDLPAYMEDFTEMMKSFGQEAIYYAHAGAGEIHLRPILDLKTREGKEDFYNISKATAELVKKYRGSLSGEHGDGRLRAPFIPLVMGDEVYKLFLRVKQIWDPQNIFNPGKIVDAPSMKKFLRTDQSPTGNPVVTKYDFQEVGGMLRLAEKCNGSGDCRKLPLSGGTMCPSYHATREEKDTTRARANVLRELISSKGRQAFVSPELADVLDLCLACKACTSECPSNINMTLLKSESLYQKGLQKGFPLRSKFFGYFGRLFNIGSKLPSITNWMLQRSWLKKSIKNYLGIAKERSLPLVAGTSLRKWMKNYNQVVNPSQIVYLFCDEFTNYLEPQIGIKAVKLLNAIGYLVKVIQHPESGRASMSKGLLDYASRIAEQNIEAFAQHINETHPLLGIEPSAILSFREEYPRLVRPELRDVAEKIRNNTFLIEEFIARSVEKGMVDLNIFDSIPRNIIYHGHCHQKSLSQEKYALELLSLPSGHSVTRLDTGCCGMAGSFGYEKEHFEISKKIADISLIPAINNAPTSTIVVASGTSCRHQIKDLAGRKALHPVEVLHAALLKN